MFSLESSMNKILKEREEVLRLKSKSIWMESGDDNTKFFQDFSKGIKQQNTIWEFKNANNETTTSFEDLTETGRAYFENMFKAD